MKLIKFTLLAAAILLLAACASSPTTTTSVANDVSSTRNSLPAHPEDLIYAQHSINIPDPAAYRYQLDNGNVAYIVPDSALPLVAVSVHSRGGRYLLGTDNAGLAALTASMMRDGGTKKLSPEELDEKLVFLATSVHVAIGATSSSASMNSLSSNLDESLDLLFDVIAEPTFDEERLKIRKSRTIDAMKRRNDDTSSIESQVFNDLRFGHSYRNNPPTAVDVEAVTSKRMMGFAVEIFSSPNLVISVNGDVDPKAMVVKLNKQIARLQKGVKFPAIPTEAHSAAPGLYGVDKADVTQTRVRMFHPGPRQGHPQEFEIKVMNNILGGGGFTSRITKRIRSDEGLAYSAGSVYQLGRYFPGMYLVYFQSKNPSVPQAAKIALEEIAKIQADPVSEQELNTARQAIIAGLNERYSNAAKKVSAFVSDEIDSTPKNYWSEFENNTAAVSIAAVQKAARDHLDSDKFRILLTGKLSEASEGDGEHGSIESVTGLKLQQIPLRDPLTLKPLPLK
ncbi:MAG: insulinase family protein [Xanthomonadales bacterium]|nr:insulinase family protein [Xanthomonadales bacterium]